SRAAGGRATWVALRPIALHSYGSGGLFQDQSRSWWRITEAQKISRYRRSCELVGRLGLRRRQRHKFCGRSRDQRLYKAHVTRLGEHGGRVHLSGRSKAREGTNRGEGRLRFALREAGTWRRTD